jgi:hypothetical protein
MFDVPCLMSESITIGGKDDSLFKEKLGDAKGKSCNRSE